MNGPKKIYLQVFGDNGDERTDAWWPDEDVTWCEDRIYDSDVEYIRADIAYNKHMGRRK
jgi:hypothetical protein